MSETLQNNSQYPSFIKRYHFWLILVLAIVIRYIPILSIPFNWLASYFHEISHGIAALLTGGEIKRIQLFANGAGLCTTLGGSNFLTSFFGYAGATIWGTLIYAFVSWHKKIAQYFAFFMMFLLAISILLWVRDLLTLIIIGLLIGMFFMSVKFKHFKAYQEAMQLIGMLVLLNSLASPSYLLDGRHLGDGAALANLTGIPEFIWICLWSAFAIAAIYYLSKLKRV